MRAARLHAYHEQLKLDSVEEPKAIDPLAVVVRIGAAGLCRTDLHIQQGQWAEKSGVELPRSVVKLDAGLEPKDVAALADAGLTAIHAVKKAIPVLSAGTRAVVIGAGGLGHIGIQCMKAMTPAEVIVIDPSEMALALAAEVGADHTVKVDGSHVDTIKEMTDGLGAEAIGEQGAIEDGIAIVRDGGFYYVIGYGENVNLPTIDIISREISFIGNLVGTYNDLTELMTLTAQGEVGLHTSTYPLDAINDAMADLDGGRLQGRGILIPAGV